MPRAKRQGPKFTGELARPIDIKIVFPQNKKYWQEFSDKKVAELFKQRKAKIFLLAKFLGIEFEHLDLSKDGDALSFYGCLAMNLAIHFVPGFQEANPGRWPREIVMWALVDCEKRKQQGDVHSDLPVCLDWVKAMDPEMAKNTNRGTSNKRAMQLRNRVSMLRKSLKRQHAKQLH